MKALKASLLAFSPIEEEALEDIVSKFKEEHFKKKVVVERSGNTYKKLYFIEKGLARLYYSREGKDITGWFSKEGDFITANDSFFQKKPSLLNLEFIEDSIVYSITVEEIERLFDKYHQFERFGRILTYQLLGDLSEKMYSILFQSAEKRYQLLMTHDPEIVVRAPLGDIATFLGISQETLSRIRGQMAGKKH
jgi:CRP-like cAMP-binding protein